jgi:preprotein translocase subunit Sec63
MKISQAADILGMEPGSIADEATVKQAYRRAAQKYHPDKGGSTEMMQTVNEAYNILQSNYGSLPSINTDQGYADRLNDAINAIVTLPGLIIEVCGLWVWVSGDTKTHKEVLKAVGYYWASKKFMWYFRPVDQQGGRGKSTMDDIRTKYGSQTVATRQCAALA